MYCVMVYMPCLVRDVFERILRRGEYGRLTRTRSFGTTSVLKGKSGMPMHRVIWRIRSER